ncbi:MAG: hypothetical protein AAF399_13020 [Bacteroidota bacterium]
MWNKLRFYIFGILLGSIGGFLYWKYVGCLTGSCSIASVWYRMVPYGALMGGLLGGIVQDWVRMKDQGSESKDQL